jgi:type I restriction enzyme S subunit
MMKDELKIIPLGDAVAKIKTGSTPPTSHAGYFGGDIPWFTPGDIGSTKNLIESTRTLTQEAISEGEAKLFEKGMLLVTCIGDIGRVGILQQPSYSNQQITALKFKDDIDSDFAYYWFVSNKQKLVNLANQAIVPILNNERLSEVEFAYPPLTEQKRIASLLARADRLRQLRRTAHDLGDALLQSVFLEMFGDIAVNPKGWDIATLEDLETDFIYGTSQKCFSEPKGLPVLRIPNILHGSIDLEDLKYAEVPEKEAKNILLKHGDIIFVRTNGNPDYVGRCAVFNLDKDLLFASYLIRARVDLSKINPVFLLNFLQTAKGREAMAPYIRTTAGQSNIGIEGLGQIPVPVPPLSLQEEFAGVVARVESLRGRMGESTRGVEGLFESLLAESFGG